MKNSMNERSEKGLLNTLKTFREALFKNDRQKLDQIIALDYRGYTIYGMLEEREAILEMYGSNLVQLEKYDTQDIQTEVIGEIGILTGRGYIRGRYKNTVFEHQVRFLDIYRFRESNWQLYLTQITEITTG